MPVTNRFGDMLLELRDVSTPQARLDEIARLFNEASDREERYQNFLRLQDSRIGADVLDLPFVPIYSKVLERDYTSVEIPIPGTYKHLLLISSGRVSGTDAGSPYRAVEVQFNGDTTSGNYQWQELVGTSSTAVGVHDLSHDAAVIAFFQNQSADANSATGGFTFIPHYQSEFWKQVYSVSGAQNYNGTNASVAIVNAYWKNTSAIKNMKVFGDASTDLKLGSALSLYGVK